MKPSTLPFGALLIFMTCILASCDSSSSQDSADGAPVVKGAAAFANQCPSGTTSLSVSSQFDLENCNLGTLTTLELAQPMTPLLVQGDCVQKTLTVRTPDRSIDTNWEVLPDNTFNVAFPASPFIFADDGSGHSNCTAPTYLKLWGKLECAPSGTTDPDKINIKMEATWYLDGTDPDSVTTTPSASTSEIRNQCSMPKGCYLHTIKQMKQCA